MAGSYELIPIYEGPTPFADMLRDSLAEREIPSIVQAVGPFLGIIGDAARTPFSMVLVPSRELEARREDVEECVALVLPEGEPQSGWENGDDAAD